MLTAETKKLQETKERVNFFTNQLTTEVKRVGDDNGPGMIEHFIGQAQIQIEYIDQCKEIWEGFINYFTNETPDMFDTEEEIEEESDKAALKEAKANLKSK